MGAVFFSLVLLIFTLFFQGSSGYADASSSPQTNVQQKADPTHDLGAKNQNLLSPPTTDSAPSLNELQTIDNFIKKMSFDEKIGQLFIFGFSGTKTSQSLQSLISNYKPGGVIVFKRNIANSVQVAALNLNAQKFSIKHSRLPLLIMVDQEGGTVTRIKTKPSAPSALALGMTRNPELVGHAGEITGKILNLLGFNMNLAPVLDLSAPNERNFIGNRAFGGDPERVKVLGQAFADGLKRHQIIPTAKHFPGHGGVTQDSHRKLPVKLDTMEELFKKDLIPFSHFVQQSYPSAIMVAHVAFPNIDPSGAPAAFSSILINNLLRDRLGYNGLVITDDLEMAGADSAGDVGERAIRAIEAGCDMVMVAWSPSRQKKAVQALKLAVTDGRISMDRVEDSLRRILNAKKMIQRQRNEPSYKDRILPEMRNLVKDLKSLTHKVSQSNFKKSAENYPQLKGAFEESQLVLLFSADGGFFRSFRSLKKGKPQFIALTKKRIDPVPAILSKHPGALAVYYVTGEGTARRLRHLSKSAKARLIIVNSTHPGLLGESNDYQAVFDIHSRNFESGAWIAEFLFEKELRQPAADEATVTLVPAE